MIFLTVNRAKGVRGETFHVSWYGFSATAVGTYGYTADKIRLFAQDDGGNYYALGTLDFSTSGYATIEAPDPILDGGINGLSAITYNQAHDSVAEDPIEGQTCPWVIGYAVHSCGYPTVVNVSGSPAAPGALKTLSWSGAVGPYSDDGISGYKIYRATTPAGPFTLIATIASGATSGSMQVAAPTTVGAQYVYRVKTTGPAGDSNLSSAYAVLATAAGACQAPSLTVDDDTPSPGQTVTLTGIGAADGDNNPITGYRILRSINNGVSYAYLMTVTTTETNFSVSGIAIPATVGDSYKFVAVTLGSITGYNSVYSNSVQITTTSPVCTAPDTLSVSTRITAVKPVLAWTGAAPGYENAITGYLIQYSESADGETWGEWAELKTVASTARSGSTLVDIAETLGNYRRYRIQTQGTLGASYYSAWSDPSDSVRTASSTVSSAMPFLIAYEYPHVVSGVEKGAYPIGLIQGYNTMIVERVYQGVGTISLSKPFSAEDNDLLSCGNLIGIAGKNELYRMVTEKIAKDDTGVEQREVTASSMVSIVGMRVVTSSEALTAHLVDQIKALMRGQPIFLEHYTGSAWVQDINGDLSPDNYGDRRFPDFHLQEPSFDTEVTDTVTFQPEKLSNLLDTVLVLCKLEGCGVRVTGAYYTGTADTLTLWLELYKGVDRSIGQDTNPHVIFDERLGNVLEQTYTHSIEGLKTAGYATNGAIDDLIGADLQLIDVMSGNDCYNTDLTDVNGGSGMNRAEIGMTVSEAETPTTGTDQEKVLALYAAVKQIVRNEIAKATEERTFEVTVKTDVGPQYGIDYDLGDIITVMNQRYGISMNARITKAVETDESGKKVQVALTLGEPVVSLLGKVKQVVRRRG